MSSKKDANDSADSSFKSGESKPEWAREIEARLDQLEESSSGKQISANRRSVLKGSGALGLGALLGVGGSSALTSSTGTAKAQSADGSYLEAEEGRFISLDTDRVNNIEWASAGDDLQTILNDVSAQGGGIVYMVEDISGPAPELPHNVDLIGLGRDDDDGHFGEWRRTYTVTSGTVRFRDAQGNVTQSERENSTENIAIQNMTIDGIVFDAADSVSAPGGELMGFQNCNLNVMFKRFTGSSSDYGLVIKAIDGNGGGVYYNRGVVESSFHGCRGMHVTSEGSGLNANGEDAPLTLVASRNDYAGFVFDDPGASMSGNRFRIRSEANFQADPGGGAVDVTFSGSTDNELICYMEKDGSILDEYVAIEDTATRTTITDASEIARYGNYSAGYPVIRISGATDPRPEVVTQRWTRPSGSESYNFYLAHSIDVEPVAHGSIMDTGVILELTNYISTADADGSGDIYDGVVMTVTNISDASTTSAFNRPGATVTYGGEK